MIGLTQRATPARRWLAHLLRAAEGAIRRGDAFDGADRFEDGESGTSMRRELLDANKWRAMRHGHEASLLSPDGGLESLESIVAAECDRLGISGIQTVYDAESGAEAQRRIRESAGEDALCDSLLLG